MLIFSLILGGVAFYLIIYKLFVICFCYWRNLCTKHTWAKILNEYLEALLLLSSLASPALIGIYRYQHGGLDINSHYTHIRNCRWNFLFRLAYYLSHP